MQLASTFVPAVRTSSCEKVIRPLLAASQRRESASELNHPIPIDHHYEHLRAGMRDLFTALGMVA
jgi:hypothetical protein